MRFTFLRMLCVFSNVIIGIYIIKNILRCYDSNFIIGVVLCSLLLGANFLLGAWFLYAIKDEK